MRCPEPGVSVRRMKIASFNINGVRARLPALLDWLRDAKPDLVALQEIKIVDDGFPRLEVEELGYQVETHGQKSFNGVALLSRLPLEDVTRGLPGDPTDDQARWIEATVVGERQALRFCNLYLPNGNPRPGRNTTTSSPGCSASRREPRRCWPRRPARSWRAIST